jgi:hypothetical protein
MSINNQNSSDSRAKKLMPWAVAAILGLLGTNVATFIGYNNKSEQNVGLQTEVKKEEDLNAQLEQQFKESIASLEEMKGKNTELNAVIDKQKAELTAQKSKIGLLINDKKDLVAARAEIARMKATTQGYIDQIAQLEVEKKQLGEQVGVLTTEKTNLQDNLSKERTEKEQVITQKQAVEAEKMKVEQERSILAKKTEIGSVVKVTNVTTVGVKVRESGKERDRTHAKNIDRLKFCFDALDNGVVDGGRETFYLRVIDPTGVAIATSTGGGGVIKLSDGKEVQYTTSKDVEYSNKTQNVCLAWEVKGNANLVKGEYVLELYNKGYLAGSSKFNLK